MKKFNAIAVFTARGLERTFTEGGSMAWVLDARRARKYEYVVCIQNYDPKNNWGQASYDHKTAFLVGRLESVLPVPKKNPADKQRWLLKFSEYARISIPDAWPGNQNPVFYTDLETLGIDPGSLQFHPMPRPHEAEVPAYEEHEDDAAGQNDVLPLSVAEAKAGLALKYDVDPSNIKIIIEV